MSSQPAGRRNLSDAEVMKSSGGMALANLASRITGFARTVVILAVLGKAVASAFNIANTLPNMIIEFVLGYVFTALVIPEIAKAAHDDKDGGEAFIRRLVTMAGTLLAILTVLAVAAAPWLAYVSLGDGQVNLSLATAFAYLLLPQIAFYGFSALFMAILNTRNIFAPGAWAPVWNNLVMLAVFGVYWFIGGDIDPAADASVWGPQIALLGLGTTLGVVVQMAVMIPALRRANINLRPLWGLDDRLKKFAGKAVAIIVYVAISQIGLIVTFRVASAADEGAPALYQTGWLLLQVPYGVIAVALLNAITPRLSANQAAGKRQAVKQDIALATKLSMIGLIPFLALMAVFGPQIANALFAYGRFASNDATILGYTVAAMAVTIIPYSLVLIHLRVFYANDQAWTPTWIVIGITVVKVAASLAAPSLASSSEMVVVWLGIANALGYVVGAIIGALLLRRAIGPLGMKDVSLTTLRILLITAVGVGVARALDHVAHLEYLSTQCGSAGYILRMAIATIISFTIIGVLISRSSLRHVEPLPAVGNRLAGVARRVKLTK